jgi:hypothetical protein
MFYIATTGAALITTPNAFFLAPFSRLVLDEPRDEPLELLLQRLEILPLPLSESAFKVSTGMVDALWTGDIDGDVWVDSDEEAATGAVVVLCTGDTIGDAGTASAVEGVVSVDDA